MKPFLTRTTVTLLTLSLAFSTGCSTTQQARSVKPSGFLSDYSQLKEGEGDQALLVYIKPDVHWSKFRKVIIEPVAIYTKGDSDLKSDTRDEKTSLANYFAATLHEHLSKNFTIVKYSGPDVLTIRTALTDGDQSEVLINTITTVMPIGLAASTLKRVTFGSDTGVGFAQAEIEVLDSQRSTRLGAAVDKRYGTKALRSKFGSWNDAQEAMDHWAAQLTEKLVKLGAGK